ncbi:hypothetical protein BH708_03905 [Brachybacterium sp. P6-10-X1]|uniref:hypothetical protein n=1 Tax=Brachybacterium sp. P6-10-X1 TaxID=1903186 RepID=UPI000971B63F|nr:hypothetical protein [Brachybacterium sp. P6-10-X1]APX32013.1 hypothetical protein BH708_03905 [Brachybacterium sp. P6-10-X1]
MNAEAPWTTPRPATVDVTLLRDEALWLLRGRESLHPDAAVLIAALLFVDDEGIAELRSMFCRRQDDNTEEGNE